MCSIWTAFFDVKAWATKDLAAGAERLVPTASTSLEDRVVCARATVLSTKDRISKEVAHRSASHNANAWNLPQQTAVVIDGPHQEIADAAMARS